MLPQPFRPDIVVSIDDVLEKKFAALDAHVSQVYEWLAWHDGILDQVPKDAAARKDWLKLQRSQTARPEWRQAARKWYGSSADQVKNAEAFQITEYGRQPSDEEIRKLLPFFP